YLVITLCLIRAEMRRARSAGARTHSRAEKPVGPAACRTPGRQPPGWWLAAGSRGCPHLSEVLRCRAAQSRRWRAGAVMFVNAFTSLARLEPPTPTPEGLRRACTHRSGDRGTVARRGRTA